MVGQREFIGGFGRLLENVKSRARGFWLGVVWVTGGLACRPVRDTLSARELFLAWVFLNCLESGWMYADKQGRRLQRR